jgi:hypothetical protein
MVRTDEERLDIRFDRGIIIGMVEKDWLLDKNNLFQFLEPFPRLTEDCSKPSDRMKELIIHFYKELKRSGVWMELRDSMTE